MKHPPRAPFCAEPSRAVQPPNSETPPALFSPFSIGDTMHGNAPNVRGHSPLLTKTLGMAFISQAARKIMCLYDGSEDDLGTVVGVGKGGINNAINQRHEMSLHTAFNLLNVDPYALEGLLNHFGRRSVPIEAKCNTDELVPLTLAVSKLAGARADGKISDREFLEIEPEIEAAIDALLACKDRCVSIRNARAS